MASTAICAAQIPDAPQTPIAAPEASWTPTAVLAGVAPQMAELRNLSRDAGADHWRILWLHQNISERVMAVSLQVDATIAQIDNEIARANEIRGLLADRRDRTVNRANLIGILVGGGLGAASSGMQLDGTLSKPAAGVGIGAGALSAGFAIAGIRAQKGRTAAFDFNSNMLAELFDRPALDDSHYPTAVWTFLNESPAPRGSEPSRRQQLLDTWVKVQRIESLGSAQKIAQLTSQPSESRQLTIDDLEDRAAMLQDVRARISFLKRDLGLLLNALPAVEPAAADGVKP